jgi:outer membrane receptor for ferrienterochelin and colicin
MKFKYLLAASLTGLSASVVLPAPAAAQQITSGIQTKVFDESGNLLDGATVVIRDERTGTERTLVTGAGGRVSATNLVTGGPYTVSAELDGFEGQTVTDIFITLQGDTTIDLVMKRGAGEIVVTAALANVSQLAVGPGQSFSTEVLIAAPTFNRDIRDVIRIDPRVSLDRDDGGSGQDRISCLGGNDRGNAFTVDGISQGDIFGLNDTGFASRSSSPIPYDAIREASVEFAPFDVEYGNFTGCAINVVTQSGGNSFHGGGFFEYSDSGMRGDTVEGSPVAPIEPDKRWGAWLGGPIIPDHLFFFGAYEHQEAGQSWDDGPLGAGYPNEVAGVTLDAFNEVSDILSSVYGIETGPLVTNRPFSNDRWFGRLDWQVTEDHRLELTYQRLEESSTRADDFSTSSSNPSIPGENTFYLSGTESNYYSARLYSQWTDELSTEIRYSRSDIQDLQNPVGGGEAQDENPIPRIIVGIDPGNDGVGPFGRVVAGPGFSRSANDLQTKVDAGRFVVNYDAGDHQLKFGVEFNRNDLFNLFVQNATGELHFASIADLEAGILSNGDETNPTATELVNGDAVGAEGNFTATGVVTDAAADFVRTIYSAYAQDDWQVTDRLGAVLGVRIDWYTGGAPAENPNFVARYGFSNAHGFSDLAPAIMPRAAFTYDLDDFAAFSRAQLRGGVGIFSGGDPLVWFGNAFQNDGRGFAGGTTANAACGPGPIDVVSGGSFTGVPSCFQAAASAIAAAGLGDTQSINPDIKQPSVIRANLGFASQLDLAPTGFFSGWDLNLDYIYSYYQDPFTLVDLSQTPDIRKGLDGFTIDGRPIYQAIDPTRTGCDAVLSDLTPTPIWTGVTAACFNTGRDDELQLINGPGFDSHIASIILSKRWDRGLFTEGGSTFFSFGYSYTNSHDRRNMYSSTAGSNYDISAAFDRQNPAESRGFYSSKHNIATQLNFEEQFWDDLSTRFGITFIARSGRPFSLTFTGGGVFNDSASGFENALIYLPTGIDDPNIAPPIFNDMGVQTGGSVLDEVRDLVEFASSLSCAKDYLGQSIPRNTCSNDWYFDMDLSFSQEIPGPGRLFGLEDRVKLFASFDNFLNFLNDEWNVSHRRDFGGRQDIASISGVDSEGRYIITSDNTGNFVNDEFTNISSSVWRLKVGVSYEF